MASLKGVDKLCDLHAPPNRGAVHLSGIVCCLLRATRLGAGAPKQHVTTRGESGTARAESALHLFEPIAPSFDPRNGWVNAALAAPAPRAVPNRPNAHHQFPCPRALRP